MIIIAHSEGRSTGRSAMEANMAVPVILAEAIYRVTFAVSLE